MVQQTLQINQQEFKATKLTTEHCSILLIQGQKGNLGCGYFSIGPAEKMGDRFAIVSGVKNFDDMLSAVVLAASSTAIAAGVKVGESTGKEALLLMEQ